MVCISSERCLKWPSLTSRVQARTYFQAQYHGGGLSFLAFPVHNPQLSETLYDLVLLVLTAYGPPVQRSSDGDRTTEIQQPQDGLHPGRSNRVYKRPNVWETSALLPAAAAASASAPLRLCAKVEVRVRRSQSRFVFLVQRFPVKFWLEQDLAQRSLAICGITWPIFAFHVWENRFQDATACYLTNSILTFADDESAYSRCCVKDRIVSLRL